MTELLLGCGHQRIKQACAPGDSLEWKNLVTFDINPDCKPDLCGDLNEAIWMPRAMNNIGEKCLMHPHTLNQAPLLTDFFSEVHAYEVLEHLGYSG